MLKNFDAVIEYHAARVKSDFADMREDIHYRAKPKNISQFNYSFEGKKCIVAVSVGQHYHEGEKFDAILRFVNNNFRECHILIGDTLYRHNYQCMFGMPKKQAYEKSLNEGSLWLRRNLPAMENLTIPHHTIFWDHILEDPLYPPLKREFDKLFESDPVFRDAVNKTAKVFVERQEDRIKDPEFALAGSQEFIREECAMMIVMASRGYDYFLYPNIRTAAMQYVYDKFIDSRNPDSLRWVQLKFKEKSAASKSAEDNLLI